MISEDGMLPLFVGTQGATHPSRTVVYTDGACLGNPGPGGWAWAVRGGRSASGGEPRTTNQRMELKAALEAVRSLEGPLTIVTDSAYVSNCFLQRWWVGWEKRGWKNSKGEPVANQDLWEPLLALVKEREGGVEFRWVKGHSGEEMNELVDEMARRQARLLAERPGAR